jgi:hypothetical protein
MRFLRPLAAACAMTLFLAGVGSSAPAIAATPLPEWLAGTWAMEAGAAWADEIWTSGRGGMMLGLYRLGFGTKAEEWHMARIESRPSGALVLVIHDKGGSAVEYAQGVASASTIEFTNASRSFPQRIRFWREGQLLMTELSKIDGSEAQRRNFRPVETAPKD